MKVELGYGKTTQIIDVPDQCFRGELHANHVDVALTGSEEVESAA